jgi:hypothetical protein
VNYRAHRRTLPCALSIALAGGLFACDKSKEESQEPTPAATGSEPEVSAEPLEEAPPLVDAWYNDVDADGVPDFVELELNNDPNIDECIVEACGEKARGGELAEKINTLVILDASGSMAGKLGKKGKKTKMAMAKEAVQRFVDVMPKVEVMNFGIMAYGHFGDNTEAKKEESCSKVEMIDDMGVPDPKQVKEALKPIDATGWSPIARAIEASAQFLPEEVSSVNHIILVADGIERCDGDPVAVARELFETNHLTMIDVVGFGVEAKEDVEALKAIAATTGGRYVEASDVAQFEQAFNDLTIGTWGIFDTWLCAVSSAPLLECYDKRAKDAVARTEREIEFMSRYSGGEEAIATLEKIKTRIEQTQEGRQRVVTTYKVDVDTIRAEQEKLRKKAEKQGKK